MDIFGLSMESDVVEELALKLYGELEKIICDNDPMMFSNLIFLISNTLEQLNNRIVREKELNEKIQVMRDENEELLRKFRNRGVIIEDKDRVILQYQSEIENFHHEKELLTIDSRLMKKKINDLNKKIKELEVLVDSFESENYYKEEKLKAMERELEKKVINYRNTTTVKNQKNIFNNNSSEEKPMFPVLKSHISEDISNKLVLSNSETNHNHLNSSGSSPISEYTQVSSNSDLENIKLDFNPGANLCVVSDEQLNSELTTKAVNEVSKVTYEQSNSQSDTIVSNGQSNSELTNDVTNEQSNSQSDTIVGVVSNGQSNSELTNEQSNSELDTIVGVVSNELSNYKLDSSVVSDVINEQSNSELDTSVVDVVSSEQSNHNLDSIVSVASDVTNKQSNSELDTIVSEVASDPTVKQLLSASEKPNRSMLNISIFADATGKELSQLLKKHFSNNCNIMSLVKSNASFLQVVNSCRPESYAKNDHVVLIFGVTDIDLRRECDIFMKLEPYLTLFGGTNVWLCTLPYRFDLEANDPKQNVIQLINNYMKEIAERLAHVRVIDIYGFRQNNFSRDGVYLNAKGKKKLSGLIYKSIKTIQNQT